MFICITQIWGLLSFERGGTTFFSWGLLFCYWSQDWQVGFRPCCKWLQSPFSAGRHLSLTSPPAPMRWTPLHHSVRISVSQSFLLMCHIIQVVPLPTPIWPLAPNIEFTIDSQIDVMSWNIWSITDNAKTTQRKGYDFRRHPKAFSGEPHTAEQAPSLAWIMCKVFQNETNRIETFAWRPGLFKRSENFWLCFLLTMVHNYQPWLYTPMFTRDM